MQEIFSNTTLTVNQLIEKIDTGELGLPELQRPFIWKDSKVRDLFDSMMRGYPIGISCCGNALRWTRRNPSVLTRIAMTLRKKLLSTGSSASLLCMLS